MEDPRDVEARQAWDERVAEAEIELAVGVELSKTPKPKPMPNTYRRLLGALYGSTNLTPVYA